MPSISKPCHNCRRRRLRCDRSWPTCHKCAVSGQECLGYGRVFVWTQANDTHGNLKPPPAHPASAAAAASLPSSSSSSSSSSPWPLATAPSRKQLQQRRLQKSSRQPQHPSPPSVSGGGHGGPGGRALGFDAGHGDGLAQVAARVVATGKKDDDTGGEGGSGGSRQQLPRRIQARGGTYPAGQELSSHGQTTPSPPQMLGDDVGMFHDDFGQAHWHQPQSRYHATSAGIESEASSTQQRNGNLGPGRVSLGNLTDPVFQDLDRNSRYYLAHCES